jgi:hypothetical protein
VADAGRAGRLAVDREPEHCAGRQQDAVSEQRPTHQTPPQRHTLFRSGRPPPGLPGHRLPLRHGLLRPETTQLETHRQDMAHQTQSNPPQAPRARKRLEAHHHSLQKLRNCRN